MKQDASTHYQGKYEHRPATAQFFANEESDYCPDEASEIIHRSHEALHGWRRMVEVLDEVLTDDDTAEDACAYC